MSILNLIAPAVRLADHRPASPSRSVPPPTADQLAVASVISALGSTPADSQAAQAAAQRVIDTAGAALATGAGQALNELRERLATAQREHADLQNRCQSLTAQYESPDTSTPDAATCDAELRGLWPQLQPLKSRVAHLTQALADAQQRHDTDVLTAQTSAIREERLRLAEQMAASAAALLPQLQALVADHRLMLLTSAALESLHASLQLDHVRNRAILRR